MNSLDLIRMAFSSLWRRKVRTILTILGVLIGSSSIVVMMSLGVGIDESINKSISTMGSINTITVNPGYGGGMYMETSSRSSKKDDSVKLTESLVEQISQLEHVTGVMKVVKAQLKFVSGRYTTYVEVSGINPEIMEDFDIKVDKGRLLNANDTNAVVFGGQVPYNFRNPKKRNDEMYFGYMGPGEERPAPLVDVLNDSMIMTFDMSYGENTGMENKPAYKRYKVEGVGIMDSEQYNENSYSVFMNIDYLLKIKKENQKILDKLEGKKSRKKSSEIEYDQLSVRVDDIKNVESVQQQITDLGLNAWSMTQIVNEMKKSSSIIQALLGGIGAVSLFVAAIGITNTMVMSIYERTKEIGVMKVLGCLIKNIRSMFLIESGLIGFIGGAISIGLSFLISFLVNKVVGPSFMGGGGPMGEEIRISIIPFWLASFSIVFSTMIGILSGLYPAIRATKISALKAISTE